MKTKDTTLSDLFMKTAIALEESPAEHMECVCQFLCTNLAARTGFITAFKPDGIASDDRWFDTRRGNSSGASKKELEAIKVHRVTAVLLMHALAKDYEEAGFSSKI